MLADPLAEFRTADGGVAYEAEEARWVVKGDWIQACHGDEGNWQEVVSTVHAPTKPAGIARSVTGLKK